jgi:pilus assembly protein FimV
MLLTACLLSSSFFGPSLSWALGLGEIHLNSALNEPMNAEIDLIAAAPDELTALRATLASRESFTRYGIDKPPFLSTLTFKVGKSKDGRDVLEVRSTDAIPEPFVTFLVEVNWARGRLMREYTVLLDPPVYTPGENPSSSAPVTAPTTAAAPARKSSPPITPTEPVAAPPTSTASSSTASSSPSTMDSGAAPGSIRVNRGDTLNKIVHGIDGPSASPVVIDQTMIAMYRANPEAFGGNINILRQGSILRVPGADEIAALNQKEAVGEVHRQVEAWRAGEAGNASATTGHLRLVTPSAGGSATGTGHSSTANSNANNTENQALKDRVKDLEGQLADSKRLGLAAQARSAGDPACRGRDAGDPAGRREDRTDSDPATRDANAGFGRHDSAGDPACGGDAPDAGSRARDAQACGQGKARAGARRVGLVDRLGTRQLVGARGAVGRGAGRLGICCHASPTG